MPSSTQLQIENKRLKNKSDGDLLASHHPQGKRRRRYEVHCKSQKEIPSIAISPKNHSLGSGSLESFLSISKFLLTPMYCQHFITQQKPGLTGRQHLQPRHRPLGECLLKTSPHQQWLLSLRSSDLRNKSRLVPPLQYMKKSKHHWLVTYFDKSNKLSPQFTEQLRRSQRRPLERVPTGRTDPLSRPFRKRGLLHWMQVARNQAEQRSCGPRQNNTC